MSRSFKTKPTTRKVKYLHFDSRQDSKLHTVWLGELQLEAEHARKVVAYRNTERIENRA